MKSLKYLVLIPLFLMTECKKEEGYELDFGEIQTGFLLDSIYQTESSGLLYVQFDTIALAILGILNVWIN